MCEEKKSHSTDKASSPCEKKFGKKLVIDTNHREGGKKRVPKNWKEKRVACFCCERETTETKMKLL
jgi:hypothetical protein